MLSILVPTLQGGRRLTRLLSSIPTDSAREILVLSGPRAMPAPVPRRLRSIFREIRCRRRLWTAEALGALLSAAHGRFVLYLNDDAVLLPGALEAFAGAARTGRAVCGKVLDLAAPSVLQSTGTILRAGSGAQRGFATPDDGRYNRPSPVFGVGGPAFLYAREEIEAAGGFDRSLTAYHEDTDLAIRFRARGGTARYHPRAAVLHEGSASFVLYSSTYAYFATRNALRVFARLPVEARRALWPRARAGSESQVLRFAALDRTRSALQGLHDALRSLPNEPSYRLDPKEVLRWERAWPESPPRGAEPKTPSQERRPLGILSAGALPAARLAARWKDRAPMIVRPAGVGGFDPEEADRYPRFRRLVVAVNHADGTGYANCLLLARRIADRVETVGPDGKIRPCPGALEAAYARERARIRRARRETIPILSSFDRIFGR